jgi:integrase
MTENSKPKRERGSGRLWQIGRYWYIQFYNANGEQIRVSTKKEIEKEAAKILKDRLAEVRTGTHVDTRRLTYADLRRGFFDHYMTKKRKSLRWTKDKEPRLDAVTRLDNFFEGYRASAIDYDSMVEFQKKLQKEGKADATINRSIAALRCAFRIARKAGKIRVLPEFPMLTETNTRTGTLDQAKYPLLLAVLPEYLKPVLALGYHTGARAGEILRLRWEQVDFLGRVIRLNAGETKNNQGRSIPIDDELYRMLEDCYLKRPEGCPFVCNRNGRPIGDFRRVWYDRCSKLGLGRLEDRGRRRGKYSGLIFHDLRRTFITDAENAGAPRHEVMKGTGHITEATYKRYAIGSPEGQQSAMNKIQQYRAEQARIARGDGEKTGQNEVQQVALGHS